MNRHLDYCLLSRVCELYIRPSKSEVATSFRPTAGDDSCDRSCYYRLICNRINSFLRQVFPSKAPRGIPAPLTFSECLFNHADDLIPLHKTHISFVQYSTSNSKYSPRLESDVNIRRGSYSHILGVVRVVCPPSPTAVN